MPVYLRKNFNKTGKIRGFHAYPDFSRAPVRNGPTTREIRGIRAREGGFVPVPGGYVPVPRGLCAGATNFKK